MKVLIGLSLSALMVLPLLGADVTSSEIQSKAASGKLDYANAISLDRSIDESQYNESQGSANVGEPGFKAGTRGTGEMLSETLGSVSEQLASASVAPLEYGTANHPYTTSRVDMFGQRLSRKYPNRISGKLFFNNNGSTYVCSASSINKGLVVTAAHCVYNNSADHFYSDWEFIPAYYASTSTGAKAPYGRYGIKNAWIKTSYIDDGVISENDVSVMAMKMRTNPDTGTNMYPGERTGTYAYGWNGYSFATKDGIRGASITELGYPVSHDRGWMMQKTNSTGYVDPGNANNTIIGSRQTGGASGGPLLVNYGETAVLSGTSVGTAAVNNAVVGVASWKYVNDAVKILGASPFTDTNIVSLVDAACTNSPDNCY